MKSASRRPTSAESCSPNSARTQLPPLQDHGRGLCPGAGAVPARDSGAAGSGKLHPLLQLQVRHNHRILHQPEDIQRAHHEQSALRLRSVAARRLRNVFLSRKMSLRKRPNPYKNRLCCGHRVKNGGHDYCEKRNEKDP